MPLKLLTLNENEIQSLLYVIDGALKAQGLQVINQVNDLTRAISKAQTEQKFDAEAAELTPLK